MATKQATKTSVNKVAKLLVEAFGTGDNNTPTIYEPGFHADEWTIAWEGCYDYDWTSKFSDWLYTSGKYPAGVYIEALNHWSIAIYRD